MELIIYILLIISITFIMVSLYGLFFEKENNYKERLEVVQGLYKRPLTILEGEKRKKSFAKKAFKNLNQKISSFLSKITPAKIIGNIKKNIMYAGSSSSLNANKFLRYQFLLALIFPFISYIVFLFTERKIKLILLLLMTIVAFFIPTLILRSKAQKRQEEIKKSLPEILDLLYISVEAGLAFDMALKRTIEKMKGPLADEFKRALEEINRGRVRSDALKGVVYRTGVPELASFITAVIQSEQLGSDIATTLKVQSISVRQKRRQLSEEKAQKVPVKMLLPLMLFLFPALFIVILGPAIIQVLGMF